MRTAPSIRPHSLAARFAAFVLVVAVFYFAREILVPLALAVLLSFFLAPVVGWVQRLRIHRVPAVIIVMLVFLTAVASAGWTLTNQLLDLADHLPEYQANVHEKLQALHPKSGGLVERLNHTLTGFSNEIESITTQPAATSPATTTASAPTQPVAKTVEVKLAKEEVSGLKWIGELALMVRGTVTTLGIVLILAIFLLIQREDMRDRVIRLAGHGRMYLATSAMDDAAQRVSRYLLMQAIVNVCFGACIAAGLALCGIPYFVLWGSLATCLRFIPYFGTPIAAVFPVVFTLAATPGYGPVLAVIGIFVGLELVIANFLEPWLYGSSIGMAPLAVLVSALVWAWLWGPLGLLLSTPLTVCLVVLGHYVPALHFLKVIFGDEPVLTPEARLYQRLLAGDREEVEAISDEYLKTHTLEELYDGVLARALTMAAEDRAAGQLDEEREGHVYEGMHELLMHVAAQMEKAKDHEKAADGAAAGAMPVVACLPAKTYADELAGEMVMHLLARRGILCEMLTAQMLSGERADALARRHVIAACIVALPPRSLRKARYLTARLRAIGGETKLITLIWRPQREGKAQAIVCDNAADQTETSIAAAVERIGNVVGFEAVRAM